MVSCQCEESLRSFVELLWEVVDVHVVMGSLLRGVCPRGVCPTQQLTLVKYIPAMTLPMVC